MGDERGIEGREKVRMTSSRILNDRSLSVMENGSEEEG